MTEGLLLQILSYASGSFGDLFYSFSIQED